MGNGIIRVLFIIVGLSLNMRAVAGPGSEANHDLELNAAPAMPGKVLYVSEEDQEQIAKIIVATFHLPLAYYRKHYERNLLAALNNADTGGEKDIAVFLGDCFTTLDEKGVENIAIRAAALLKTPTLLPKSRTLVARLLKAVLVTRPRNRTIADLHLVEDPLFATPYVEQFKKSQAYNNRSFHALLATQNDPEGVRKTLLDGTRVDREVLFHFLTNLHDQELKTKLTRALAVKIGEGYFLDLVDGKTPPTPVRIPLGSDPEKFAKLLEEVSEEALERGYSLAEKTHPAGSNLTILRKELLLAAAPLPKEVAPPEPAVPSSHLVSPGTSTNLLPSLGLGPVAGLLKTLFSTAAKVPEISTTLIDGQKKLTDQLKVADASKTKDAAAPKLPVVVVPPARAGEIAVIKRAKEILGNKCADCHDVDQKQKPGNILSGAGLRGFGEIDTVDPEKSLIMRRLNGRNNKGEANEDRLMPKGGPALTADEITAVREWIALGGHDEEEVTKTPAVPPMPTGPVAQQAPPKSILSEQSKPKVEVKSEPPIVAKMPYARTLSEEPKTKGEVKGQLPVVPQMPPAKDIPPPLLVPPVINHQSGTVAKTPPQANLAPAPPLNLVPAIPTSPADLAASAHTILKDLHLDEEHPNPSRNGWVKAEYVIPGEPDKSPLVGRLKDRKVTDGQMKTIRAWISAGAPDWNEPRPDSIVQLVALDLGSIADLDSRKYMRYFSLKHLPPGQTVDTARAALIKLLNSLSTGGKMIVPISAGKDDQLLRIDMRDLKWDAKTWNDLKVKDPFFRQAQKDWLGVSQARMTKAQDWLVRGDWFVATASSGEHYQAFLGIPTTEEKIEEKLGVSSKQDAISGKVKRAALQTSGKDGQQRLLERTEQIKTDRSGRSLVYWRASNFGEPGIGETNLMANALSGARGAKTFQHSSGDIMYELPNGLHAFVSVNKAGKVVSTGGKCMECHTSGFREPKDEFRAIVINNPSAFTDEQREQMEQRFPDQGRMKELISGDNRSFVAAMKAAGLSDVKGEPISTAKNTFNADVSLKDAARELGKSPDELKSLIARIENPILRAEFLALPTAGLKRATFNELVKRLANPDSTEPYPVAPPKPIERTPPVETKPVTPPSPMFRIVMRSTESPSGNPLFYLQPSAGSGFLRGQWTGSSWIIYSMTEDPTVDPFRGKTIVRLRQVDREVIDAFDKALRGSLN